MQKWTEQDISSAVKKISEKASNDKVFRELCLKDPHRAVKIITGRDIPRGFVIRIVENDPGVDQTFVLPDLYSSELSDDELDKVAGGRCGNECNQQNGCGSYCKLTD